MPYRKSPASLEEMCLLVICNNLHTMQDKLVQQPSTFINNVFEKLCKQSESADEYEALPSKIFIRPGTESLHHLDVFEWHIESILDQIGNVCENLVNLDLSSASEIDFKHILKMLKRLPRLQRLNLVNSLDCNDQHIVQIAKSCPQLTHLDLSKCDNVNGIRALSACTKLLELNTCGTRVTAKGCIFLLNRLPLLKLFRNDKWDEIFHVLKQQFAVNQPVRVCSNSIEETSISVYKCEDIDIAIGSFPRLRNLNIGSLYQSVDLNIMLEHEIMQRLISLHLDFIDDIDILLVDRSCPNLESLKMKDCSISISSGAAREEYMPTLINRSCPINSDEDIPFKKLRVLDIQGGNIDMTELQIGTILVKCVNVEELHLTTVYAFNDNLIAELVNSSALTSVKALYLWDCNVITLDGIMDLVKMYSPLNALISTDCLDINSSVVNVIDTFVKRNKLDFEISLKTKWDDPEFEW